MRIIAGTHRRRVLETPPDATVTRPMPDMVREALFNLLRGHTEGATVFDAFAGTGAVGLEALSRGASRCVFVERDRGIGAMLQRNVDALEMSGRADVVVGDALGLGALARCPRPVHLVFFDPPYPLVRSAAMWARVREQFSKCVALLDDTGYAMLRTPWPFEHEDEAAPDPGPEREPDARRVKRGHPRRKKARDRAAPAGDGARDPASDPDPEWDEAAEEPEAPRPEKPARAPVVRTPGDLRVPGALGPETHAYGSMAIHLYMRSREVLRPDDPRDPDQGATGRREEV